MEYRVRVDIVRGLFCIDCLILGDFRREPSIIRNIPNLIIRILAIEIRSRIELTSLHSHVNLDHSNDFCELIFGETCRAFRTIPLQVVLCGNLFSFLTAVDHCVKCAPVIVIHRVSLQIVVLCGDVRAFKIYITACIIEPLDIFLRVFQEVVLNAQELIRGVVLEFGGELRAELHHDLVRVRVKSDRILL